MPALGGEPRFLVEGGYDPRYSPDGRSIAYWTGSFVGFSPAAGSYRTFVVPAGGGPPREIGGFSGARFPIWSPDGKSLLLMASRAELPTEETYDWWIVPLEGAEPVRTHALPRLQAAGAVLESGATTSAGGWLGDRLVAGTGGDLWAVAVRAASSHPADGVHRLTFGTGVEHHPTLTRAGLVAFEGITSSQNIWSIPLDAERGTVLGPPRRVTDGAGPHGRATVAADGRSMAFLVNRKGPMLLVKSLDDGRISDLGVEVRFGPVLSPDGSRVAYPGSDFAAYVMAVRGGEPRKLCERCLVGDWTSDSRRVTTVEGPGNGALIRLVDVETGQGQDLIRGAGAVVNRPHLGPDNRWLAFRSVAAAGKSRVLLAPFRPGSPPAEAEWAPITPLESDVRPCGWSPSGRLLYLLSSRDGFRCLYAQPIDTAAGRPAGPVLLVSHLHNIRGTGGGGASVVSTGAGNAVLKDQLLLDYPVYTINVWTLQLGGPR
jgi:Tol biopolymer transport system component